MGRRGTDTWVKDPDRIRRLLKVAGYPTDQSITLELSRRGLYNPPSAYTMVNGSLNGKVSIPKPVLDFLTETLGDDLSSLTSHKRDLNPTRGAIPSLNLFDDYCRRLRQQMVGSSDLVRIRVLYGLERIIAEIKES